MLRASTSSLRRGRVGETSEGTRSPWKERSSPVGNDGRRNGLVGGARPCSRPDRDREIPAEARGEDAIARTAWGQARGAEAPPRDGRGTARADPSRQAPGDRRRPGARGDGAGGNARPGGSRADPEAPRTHPEPPARTRPPRGPDPDRDGLLRQVEPRWTTVIVPSRFAGTERSSKARSAHRLARCPGRPEGDERHEGNGRSDAVRLPTRGNLRRV